MIYFIRRNIKYACILSTKLCLDLPEGIYLNRTLWIVLSFISIYRFTTTSWKFTHIRIRYNLFPASIPKSNKNSHRYNYPKILFLHVYRHIWFYIYDILWIIEIRLFLCNIWNILLVLSDELFDILNKLVFQQFLVAVTSQSNSKLLQQATATILSIWLFLYVIKHMRGSQYFLFTLFSFRC